jgi:hypothetical protein
MLSSDTSYTKMTKQSHFLLSLKSSAMVGVAIRLVLVGQASSSRSAVGTLRQRKTKTTGD